MGKCKKYDLVPFHWLLVFAIKSLVVCKLKAKKKEEEGPDMARPSRVRKEPDRYTPESGAASKPRSEPYSGPTTRSRTRDVSPPEDRPATASKSHPEPEETISRSGSIEAAKHTPREPSGPKGFPQTDIVPAVSLARELIGPTVTTDVSGPQTTNVSSVQLVLQAGLYPVKKQQKLERSRAKNPTYLFRASSPVSGSGIEVTEGDGVSIVPRTFLNGGTGHSHIYEIPDMVNMVTGHLYGAKSIASEFSSWAASLSVAMNFLRKHLSQPEARISAIDTRRFPNTAIYHVNDFQNAGFAVFPYPHEYLVHGVVRGGPDSGYTSVLWSDLRRLGISSIMPHHHKVGSPLPELLPITTIMPRLEIADVQVAKRVAMAFDPRFIVPVIAALLSHRHRSWQEPKSELATEEVEAIAKVLREGDIALVEDYSQVNAVMEDIVFTIEFEDVKQQITLLRLLSEYTHAKIRGQAAMQEVVEEMRLGEEKGVEKKKAAARKKKARRIRASDTVKSLVLPAAG